MTGIPVPAAPLICLHGISVRRDQTTILHDVSWQVNPGEHWVIFGPNGAGKTTLLNSVLGYLWPSEGTVDIMGERLGDGVDVRELRTRISIVSEAVKAMINDSLTGEEVLVTGARAHLNIFEPPTPAERDLARQLADVAGTTQLLGKPFSVMSTGERQRLVITRALTLLPRIVILDEPCAGLDLAEREWILQTIERIAAAPDAPALLLTTHHVEEVTPSFTHALLLKEGVVHAAGTIGEAFTSRNLSTLFDFPIQLTRTGGRWTARAATV